MANIDKEYNGVVDTEALTYERISRMSADEIEQFRRDRIEDFMRSLGISEEKAKRMVDSEIDLAIEDLERTKEWEEERLLREEDRKIRDKQFPKKKEEPEIKPGKVIWRGEKVPDDEDEDEDKEIFRKPSKDERDEYLKTREGIVKGLRTAKEVGRGIVGMGSRRPIKEALISGAAKAIEILKGKPKTPEELENIKLQKRHREKELHTRRMTEAKTPVKFRREIGGSFRDIGKGDMGAKEYGVIRGDPVGKFGRVGTPDFFGVGAFGMGTSVPVKKSRKIRKTFMKSPSRSIYMPLKPLSTSIPFGGNKPPSVSIGGFGGNKPPSTSLGMGRLVNPLGDMRPVKKTIGKGRIAKAAKPKKKSKDSMEDILKLKGFF